MYALLVALATLAAAPIAAPPREGPTWVFFTDKALAGDALERALEQQRAALSPRALARRVRVRGDRGVDVRDLPPAPAYVRAALAGGARLRSSSRWLNAITVEADAAQRAAIARLPFVAATRPVAASRPKRLQAAEPPAERAYGVAEEQLALIKVPDMHACGLTGEGVVIGVQDSGFILDHVAFAGAKVIAAHDFVHDDDIVANEMNDAPDQHNHGTAVLSLIIGDEADKFSGVAPGASVILAKTENVSEEKPYEEDLYVEGLEWIESMGADLFTASLGYIDWYKPADLDGNTAVTSKAAAVAISNGLIMFSAMGNSGPDPSTLIAPADVDGIISIGAVKYDAQVAGFSSRGPTADGRTKPEVSAPGAGVWTVKPGTQTEYFTLNGTSLATPLAAGVGALLLQAYPELDPPAMLALLRGTAVLAGDPNNDVGWGVIDGYAAAGLYCTCTDDDADGHFAAACGGDDCDDSLAAVYPGAAEVCDGHDNDCDQSTPADEVDADMDGVLLCAGDCDDADPTRFPGAPDDPTDCVDNDCDVVDECPATTGEATTGATSSATTTTTGDPSAGTTGPAATTDAGTGDGATSGPAAGADAQGCACTTRAPAAWPAWLLLAALAPRRRRRTT